MDRAGRLSWGWGYEGLGETAHKMSSLVAARVGVYCHKLMGDVTSFKDVPLYFVI